MKGVELIVLDYGLFGVKPYTKRGDFILNPPFLQKHKG